MDKTSIELGTGHMQEYESSTVSIAISAVVNGLLPRAKELLENKGCNVMPGGGERSIVIYPEGTTRQELFPQTSEPRYIVRFRNGFELKEVCVINSDERRLSVESPNDKAFLRQGGNMPL